MSTEAVRRTHVVSDGRTVDLAVAGEAGAPAVVFHHGTPQVRETYAPFVDAVTRRGLRWVSRSRPGYGGSTRRPGRSVLDDTADVTEVLDHLDVDRFVAMGWSGGGPHALACGAALAPRCAGVVVIAGVAPFAGAAAAGLDFLAGMGPENHDEFGAAVAGEASLREYLEPQRVDMVGVTGEQVGAMFGGLVDAPDLAVLTGEFADAAAAAIREAMATGVDGWLDDDLAFVAPWGFELSKVRVPVGLWQGDADRMVPYAHGVWLAERLTTARPHLLGGEGHLSVALGRFEQMLDEAVAFFGRR